MFELVANVRSFHDQNIFEIAFPFKLYLVANQKVAGTIIRVRSSKT